MTTIAENSFQEDFFSLSILHSSSLFIKGVFYVKLNICFLFASVAYMPSIFRFIKTTAKKSQFLEALEHLGSYKIETKILIK